MTERTALLDGLNVVRVGDIVYTQGNTIPLMVIAINDAGRIAVSTTRQRQGARKANGRYDYADEPVFVDTKGFTRDLDAVLRAWSEDIEHWTRERDHAKRRLQTARERYAEIAAMKEREA